MSETILVINGVGSLRRFTVKVLKSMGYANVLEAENGQEAIDKMEALVEDPVIILEFTASQTTADEVEFLKSFQEKYPSCIRSMIITSQSVDRDLVIAVSQFGIKNFIIKHGDLDAFSNKLKETIANFPQELCL
jgi:two-component system chemotaxis response regulator CheY